MNPKAFLSIGIAIAACIFIASRLVDRTDYSQEKVHTTSMPSPERQANRSAPAETIIEPGIKPTDQHKISPPTISKRAEAVSLANSANPQDKFRAYKIIADCVDAREKHVANHGSDPSGAIEFNINKNSVNESTLCGDISTAEISQRMQWLEAAASHGVHGAAQAFINVGPGGFGHATTPDKEWESRALKYLDAGARNGDLYSLLNMSQRYESGQPEIRNPSVALAYYELAMEASRNQNGKPLYQEGAVVRRLQAQLTKDQLEAVPTVKDSLTRKAQ